MRCFWFSLVALLSVSACEEKKEPRAKGKSDAEAPTGAAAVDPSLAKAVAGAAKPGDPAAPSAATDGPPESGVFEPGRADAELKRGEQPKVVVGDAGQPPRRKLFSPLLPGWKETGQVELSLRAARQMMPPVTASVAFEALKPKAGEEALGVPVTGRVSAILVGELEGQVIPAELKTEVAKLKGGQIQFRVLGNGAAVDHRYELPKGADPNLNTLLRALSEALASAALVFPSEEVGVGATWLVTSREFFSGADTLGFQMLKLESLSEQTATVSISTRRYAATTALTLAGLPPGNHRLDQFQFVAGGSVQVRPGSLFPYSGEVNQQLSAALVPEGNDQQRMGIQSALVSKVAVGKPPPG